MSLVDDLLFGRQKFCPARGSIVAALAMLSASLVVGTPAQSMPAAAQSAASAPTAGPAKKPADIAADPEFLQWKAYRDEAMMVRALAHEKPWPSDSAATLEAAFLGWKARKAKLAEPGATLAQDPEFLRWKAARDEVLRLRAAATNEPWPEESAATLEAKFLERQARIAATINADNAVDNAVFAKTKAGKVCKKHPDWSRSVCQDVAAHMVSIGMTQEQAREACATGWLRRGPDSINQTVTPNGVYEQWIYGYPGPVPYSRVYQYLYFTNGILTSFQLAR